MALYKFILDHTKYQDFRRKYHMYFYTKFIAQDTVFVDTSIKDNFGTLMYGNGTRAFKIRPLTPDDVINEFLITCWNAFHIKNEQKYKLWLPLTRGISWITGIYFVISLFWKLSNQHMDFADSWYLCSVAIGIITAIIYFITFSMEYESVELSTNDKVKLILPHIAYSTDIAKMYKELNAGFKDSHNNQQYNTKKSTENQQQKPRPKTLEESYTEHKESLVRKLTSDNSEKAKSNPTVRKAIDEIADMNMKADLSWLKESGITEQQQEEIANKLEIQEQKKLANHVAYEGRISATDKRKLKTILGYNCMVCGKNMKDKYGDIGNGYIELHHKIPYANMAVNDTRMLNKDDFCVLCPDCHRMIHKLKDAGDLELLKTIIAIQNPNDKVSISEYTSQQKQEYDYFDDDDD